MAADDLSYGMARMYSKASQEGDIDVSVFKTMAEARAWLGIEEPEDGSS